MSYIRDAIFPGLRDYYISSAENRSRRESRSHRHNNRNRSRSRSRPRSSYHTSRRDSADSGYSSYAPSTPIPRERRKSSSGYDSGYDYEPTYGTYVWERTNKKDPADCPCKCCPHSYAGARRAAGPSSRHDDPPSGNMHGSVNRTWYPHASEYVDGYGSPVSDTGRHSSRSHKPSQIKVVNETEGSLRRKYGSRFSIGLTRGTSVDDIVSTLARDNHKYKVIVHWDDGTSENLQGWMPVSELRRYATYLEVKQKKRVRFA